MINAKKLKLNLDVASLNRPGKVLARHALTTDFPDGRLVRKYMPNKYVEQIKQALPESVQAALITISYSEIHLLRAHVHTLDEAVINLYQQANGEKTTFWDGEIKIDDNESFDNGNNYFTISHENLAPSESFIAQSGEAWLLNVKHPHSVSRDYESFPSDQHFMPDEGVTRYAIQAYFNKPYVFIADELAKAGMVE
jgi:hypothetical protein